MNITTIQTTKDNIEDIASILDIEESSPVKVQDLFFPYGYFQEFPDLKSHIDNTTFSNLKSGNIEAVKFIGLN